MNKKILIVILSVILFVTLSQTVLAVSWWPLVPCGTSANPTECNRCDLFKLAKNIIDFVLIGLMPPAAAILFVWGGFLILMGGAVPANISKGKDIFWNTAIGVAIILASWLITNSIIRSIAADNIAPEWWKFECSVTTPAQQPPAPVPPGPQPPVPVPPGGVLSISTSSFPNATQNSNYSQSLSATGGIIPYAWSVSSGALPAGISISGNSISGTPTTIGTSTFAVKVEDSSNPKKSATKQLSIVVAVTGTLACGASWETNLCQPRSMTCNASACGQYVTAINQYAGRTGVTNGANFLKAIMIKESACNVGAQSGSVPPSCGLMQLKASTASIYKTRCGVPSNVDITCNWLKDPANANTSICIAAEFMGALTRTSCGSMPRGVSAGYNGGSGACANSVSCAGDTSCDNSPVRKWECLYDNPQRNACNTGYAETRDYATKVLYCYNNPGF